MRNSGHDDSTSRTREILRNRYPQLSDHELRWERGDEETLLERLQRRTGDSRESIAALLRSAGINISTTRRDGRNANDGDRTPKLSPDIDHSRGSGIPDDTSRSGGMSM